jgi:hypothetical protein
MDDVRTWIGRGIKEGQSYLIVVCDTFDYEDYPVYAKSVKEAKEEYDAHNGKDMQKVMEIYDLTIPTEPQIQQPRAWSVPW